MASGVYCIASCDGRRYIGSAVNIDKRWKEHRRGLSTGKHHSRFMQRVWNKRGPGAFAFSVLLLCDREKLLMYEQRCLDAFKPEFNTCPTAGSRLGSKMSDEARARMSASSASRRRGSNFKGRKHSPESLAKISASRKGKGGGPRSPERLAKISAALKGRVITDEQRQKIAATLRGTSTGRGSLSAEQVREVRRLNADGLGRIRIARAMGITSAAADAVIGRHAYLWVE